MKVLIIYDKTITDYTGDLVSRCIRDLCIGLSRNGIDITLIIPRGNIKGINTVNMAEDKILQLNLDKFDVINDHTEKHLIYNRSDINKLNVCASIHNELKYKFPEIDLPCLISSSSYLSNKVSYITDRPVRTIHDTLNSNDCLPNIKREDYVIYYAPITPLDGIKDVMEICSTENLVIIGDDILDPVSSVQMYNQDIIYSKNKYVINSYLRNAKCMIYPIKKSLTNGLNIILSTLLNTKVIIRKTEGVDEYISTNENIFKTNEEAKDKIKDIDNIPIQPISFDYSIDRMVNQYKSYFEDILSSNKW